MAERLQKDGRASTGRRRTSADICALATRKEESSLPGMQTTPGPHQQKPQEQKLMEDLGMQRMRPEESRKLLVMFMWKELV